MNISVSKANNTSVTTGTVRQTFLHKCVHTGCEPTDFNTTDTGLYLFVSKVTKQYS